MERLSMFYFEVSVIEVDASKAIILKDLQRSHCIKCGKFFTNKRGLKQHVVKMHNKMNILKKQERSNIQSQRCITSEVSSEGPAPSIAQSIMIVSVNPGEDDIRSPARKKSKDEKADQDQIKDIDLIQSIVGEMVETIPDIIDKNFQCGECGDTFREKPEYEIHFLNEHVGPCTSSSLEPSPVEPDNDGTDNSILVDSLKEVNNEIDVGALKKLLADEVKTRIEKENVVKELETKINNLEEENSSLKRDVEKVLKEKAKTQKDVDAKIKDMDTDLTKAHSEVRKCVSENVKLAEEIKTLKLILKTNNELYEKLKEREPDQGTNDVQDESTNDIDDEELLAFDLLQRQNSYKRTDPTSEARRESNQARSQFTCEFCGFIAKNAKLLQGHKTGHLIKCKVCQTVFKTHGLLRRHSKTHHGSSTFQDVPSSIDQHTIKCTFCDFLAKTNTQLQKHLAIRHESAKNQARNITKSCELCDFRVTSDSHLEKHMKVRHEKQKTSQHCRYWLRGACNRGAQCRYKHEFLPTCRYGFECPYWPNCKYSHNDIQHCKFQDFCQNSTCPYTHFLGSSRQVQPPPPLNSFQHFPPLNSVGQWRPW